jgi:hypothetical protein
LNSRSIGIVRNVDRTNLELIDLLATLTEADMPLPCADPSGGTVGEIVAHLSEGAPEVFAYLTAVVSGSFMPPADTDGHESRHDHTHDTSAPSADPAAVLELVRVRRQMFTDFVGKLTDEQLESGAPAAPGITDGTRTLAEVIDDMVDHQAQHLAYLREAIDGREVPAADAP